MIAPTFSKENIVSRQSDRTSLEVRFFSPRRGKQFGATRRAVREAGPYSVKQSAFRIPPPADRHLWAKIFLIIFHKNSCKTQSMMVEYGHSLNWHSKGGVSYD
jgi:hypothetical protein